MTGRHAQTDTGCVDSQQQQRKNPGRQRPSRSDGGHGQAGFRASILTTQATRTFGIEHPIFAVHGNLRRTGPAASAAIGAVAAVPADFKWAKQADQTEQRTVRAEVTAPNVFDQQRQQGDNRHYSQRHQRHISKKMQHFDIAEGPVGGFQERGNSSDRHVNQQNFDKKTEQQVFQAPQGNVKPAPDGQVAAKKTLPQLPAALR